MYGMSQELDLEKLQVEYFHVDDDGAESFAGRDSVEFSQTAIEYLAEVKRLELHEDEEWDGWLDWVAIGDGWDLDLREELSSILGYYTRDESFQFVERVLKSV